MTTQRRRLWNRLRDRFSDHSLQDLCDLLNAMGVPATLGDQGRQEEKLTADRGQSLGLIELDAGPIRWVVLKRDLQQDRPVYFIEYGIPDPKINGYFGETRLVATALRASPLFGSIVAVRWMGKAPGSLASQLESNAEATQLFLDNGGLTIEAVQRAGCWIMTAHRSPTAPVFRAYLNLADQLVVPL